MSSHPSFKILKLNRLAFGHITVKKKDILTQISNLQSLPQTSYSIEEEETLQKDLDEILKRDEILWRDKVKSNWLEEGDANTRFFHLSIILKRRYNNIDCLLLALNRWIRNWHDIGQEFVHFYDSLFASDLPVFPLDLENLIATCISDDINRMLTTIPSTEVIRDTVFNMNAHKSLGLDEFPPLFYKQFWHHT